MDEELDLMPDPVCQSAEPASEEKKKKKQEYVRNVQVEVDSGVIAYMERYENYNKTAYRFSLDKFVDKKLVSHLTARSATYDTTTVNKWTLKNYMIREMDGMRENIIKGDRLDTIIKMEPQDFLITKGMQQTMTRTELDEYIAKQKRRGFANITEFLYIILYQYGTFV